MKPHHATSRAARQAGFTLVEIIIAAAAMVFVLVYTLNTFTVNRNSYVIIDNVSETHQNAIAISQLMERDIRHAGYMVLPRAAACGIDSTNAPDTLFVSDSDAILPVNNLADDFLDGNLGASPNSVALNPGTPQTVTLDDLVLDGVPTYDTDATAGADSDFRVNAGVILTHRADPTQGIFCGRVTDVNAGASQIDVDLVSSTDGNPVNVNSQWVFVPAHIYQIAGNVLSRNDSVLARHVEDLQLAWFYDLNQNGQVDANEDFGSGGGEPDFTPHSLANAGLLREVRLNLVLRTADQDPNDQTNIGVSQPRENQTTAPAADGRRRRVHTATIRIRNLGA